jgi:cell shape-determining protein MreC
MNWELLFIISSASVLFFFSFLFGFFVATRFSVVTRVSRKEDYELKIQELDRMMDEWNQKVNEVETLEEPKQKIRTIELFPEDLQRDFGLPRELK